MSTIARKFVSAWKMILTGEWIELTNNLLRLLRLNRSIWVSKTLMFIKSPTTCLGVPLSSNHSRFEIEEVGDPSIIPALVQCLEGTKDYSYTPEQLKDKFEMMFQNGSHVWIAKDTEEEMRIAGLLWITSRQYPIQERILLLLPDALSFQEFVFIREEYRRFGLYSQMIQTAHRHLKPNALGSIVPPSNLPSIQAHQKNGFQGNGAILYFYFFGLMLASFRFGNVKKRLFRIKLPELYKIDLRH